MINSKKQYSNILKSNSGFIIADFLFAFVLVLGMGILIFAFTFSLATIEIAQYIVWTSARQYSAGNYEEVNAATEAKVKFDNISKQFPLLTGQGGNGASWFNLQWSHVGNLAVIDPDFSNKVAGDAPNASASVGELRTPWIGASATIDLKLFSKIKIPFIGKVAEDDTKFKFPIRAFVLRHPSVKECQEFFTYENRFEKGIKKIEEFEANMTSGNMTAVPSPTQEQDAYVPESAEDNGC